LIVPGAKIDEQVENIAQDLRNAGVAPVDLVDYDDYRVAERKGFAQDEAGWWQGAFGGVNQQHHAVHHGKGPFLLSAKVGMAGGVQYVYFYVLPDYRAVLGGDRIAPLAFLSCAQHRPFAGFGIRNGEGKRFAEAESRTAGERPCAQPARMNVHGGADLRSVFACAAAHVWIERPKNGIFFPEHCTPPHL